MSRKKIQPVIEDQITDFFTDAPQGAVETLLRVCTRIVGKRFPPVVEVKPKSNGKSSKVAKSALGGGLKPRGSEGDPQRAQIGQTLSNTNPNVKGNGAGQTGPTPPALDLSNAGPAKEANDA